MPLQDNPALLKTIAAYNAAADHFDDRPLAFWDRHGRRTVERLDLRPGARVLDAGCGAGAAALPAAAAVGPKGHVVGVDVAQNLLARARAKATAQGLENVAFAHQDMGATGFSNGYFDAVISVFSLFFVEDMERLLKEFRRVLRPGGKLAVTVWAPDAWQPGASIFSEEIRLAKPDLPAAKRPWERLTDEASIRRLLFAAGFCEPDIRAISDQQPLRSVEDWWTIALGSGFRGDIDQLTAEQRDQTRRNTLRRLSEQGVSAIEFNSICAVATKPL